MSKSMFKTIIEGLRVGFTYMIIVIMAPFWFIKGVFLAIKYRDEDLTKFDEVLNRYDLK